MLAGRPGQPFLRRGDRGVLERVGAVVAREQAALVHEPAQIGRDGDVGRGGEDGVGEFAAGARQIVQHLAERHLRRLPPRRLREGFAARHRDPRRLVPAGCVRRQRRGVEEAAILVRRPRHALEEIPLVAFRDAHAGAELLHLPLGHQAGVVVLVTLERQADALDGVGDEQTRTVVGDGVEHFDQPLEIVAPEVGHQQAERGVVAPLQQGRHARPSADVRHQPPTPRRPALEGQGGVVIVGTGLDPLLDRLAAGFRERLLQQPAPLQDHDLPATRREHLGEAVEHAVRRRRVEALAVVVDDPPGVAQVVLGAFDDRLVDVALIQFGVAEQRDHPPLTLGRQPVAGLQIVLHQRGEGGDRDPQTHRPGGEIDVVLVLGPRRIGLGAAEGAEPLQLVAGLAAVEVLDGVVGRAGVRLDRDAILGPQHAEIQRRQDGGQ